MKHLPFIRYAILLIVSINISFQSFAQKENTFKSPDFNYPQTVIENADAMLAKALKGGDGEAVALALIQSSLAKSSISEDSLPSILSSIDNIIKIEKDKNIKSILLLLEAKIITDYYQENRYTLSQRVSIDTAIDNINNIFEWNELQFKIKISTLLDIALSNKELISTPVTAYPELIIINNISIDTYPTLYDFITYQAIDIYEKMGAAYYWNPFAKSSNNDVDIHEKVINLYDQIIASHAGDAPRIKAILNKMVFSRENSLENLEALYQQYKHSVYSAPIILEIINKSNDEKKNYNLLITFLKNFPDNPYFAEIETNILDLKKSSANLSFSNQYTSSDSIKIKCDFANINHFNIEIYAVNDDDIKRYSLNLESSKPVYSQSITVKGSIPFTNTLNITVPPLPYGRYAAIVTPNNGKRETHTYFSYFTVTDIASFSTINHSKMTRRIFAVNSITGKPYKDVTISATLKAKNKLEFSEKTNSKGFVETKNLKFTYFNFSKGNDKFSTADFYNTYYLPSLNNHSEKAHIFTDLAIYRPGETVHMAAVCYNHKKEVLIDNDVEVFLQDASYERIDSVKLTTDKHGRIAHDFILPTDCMNGEFHILIKKNDNTLSNTAFTVSEYKSPTFYIEFIDTQTTYSKDNDITITGIAKTFSDIPVAGVPVIYTISSYPINNSCKSFSTTDEQGRFSITIDPKKLDNTYYNNFITYTLNATISDKAGETQSQNTYFNIGKSFNITWNYHFANPVSFNVNNEVILPIKVESNNIDSKGKIPCTLLIKNIKSNNELTFNFDSSNPSFDFSGLKSGEYLLSAWVNEDTATNIKNQPIIIYRNTDKKCPVDEALWTPERYLECVPGDNINILLGSATDSYVYYTINYKEKILEEGWKKLSKEISTLTYPMPHESDVIVGLFCVKNQCVKSYEITIKPKAKPIVTELCVESLRDKITAGDTEKWTLHFTKNGASAANGAIIASLTDKAINQLCNNRWIFNPEANTGFTYSSLQPIRIYNRPKYAYYGWNNNIINTINELNNFQKVSIPKLNLYDEAFFMSQHLMVYTSVESPVSRKAISNDVAAYETSPGFGEIENEITFNTDNISNNQAIRTSHIKTAFWLPDLITNSDGNAYIEFVVPNYNTTWLLQAVGYDNNLNTTTILKEIVSNKPIMVKANAPRFLRQGDTVTLMASVQNATDSLQHCSAEIELFNPIDNTIFTTKKYSFEIGANNTEIASIKYTAPDSIAVIALRIKANNGLYGDGEQVLIPVLENISPVIESKPFYIEQGDEIKEIALPKFNENANITLEYCDNPMWYITSSLPVIDSKEYTTATQIAHSIFANVVAIRVAKDYPQILDAIKYWKENPQDSALVSMLAKNSELKIGNLLASPFLQDSKEQTLRMSQLAQLFDDSKNKKTISALTEKLLEFQQSDGGFTWYKGRNTSSSIYLTLNILEIIGRAKSLGAETDSGLDKIINNAIEYIDNELISKANEKDFNPDNSIYLSFAYTRSLFLDKTLSPDENHFYNIFCKSISSNWKKMNIVNKAFSAITLANFGYNDDAKKIISSIDQYSVYKPGVGRFWDNLANDWSLYSNKTALTSIILQAYYAVTPDSPHIDQIKQWLLMEKQTNDWGNSSMAAEVVYSYLCTGNTELKTAPSPIIKLNNKPLVINNIDKILGYCKLSLDLDKSNSNTLTIMRNTDVPAWGAIYGKYYAPLKDIKAASVTGLTIKKKIENLSSDTDTFKVGDKVRITLTITNSRNLEYVTLADQRAACIEPAEQISDYCIQDGLGYYMEVKDSQTNMFFNYLPKGTHIITYEAYVTNSGNFSNGIATIQCQYAPQIVAHTAGSDFNVK